MVIRSSALGPIPYADSASVPVGKHTPDWLHCQSIFRRSAWRIARGPEADVISTASRSRRAVARCSVRARPIGSRHIRHPATIQMPSPGQWQGSSSCSISSQERGAGTARSCVVPYPGRESCRRWWLAFARLMLVDASIATAAISNACRIFNSREASAVTRNGVRSRTTDKAAATDRRAIAYHQDSPPASSRVVWHNRAASSSLSPQATASGERWRSRHRSVMCDSPDYRPGLGRDT